MKLRDIIKLSSIMLSLDDIITSEELYNEEFDIKDEKSIIFDGTSIERTINLMIHCFNIINSEIATDYFPLVSLETIEVKNGIFNLASLDHEFYKLVKLEDKNFLSAKYEIYDNILYAKDGKYKIVYCYVPEKVTLNSEINNFNGKVLDRVFAYGINKEYCFISGLYSEADSYKTKFEESLKMAQMLKREIKLPKRRWE